MRLKYLTLNKIIDAAYYCGLDHTPVSVLIAAPPGAGKTWSARSIQDTDFVQYINHVLSPNEHRATIAEKAARTRLLINDDLGLAARWNQKEFYSTFIMVSDGEISYTQYKQKQHARMECSLVLLCTSEYFTQNRNEMRGMGLLDRVVPVILGLSQTTRRMYQDGIRLRRTTRQPPERDPAILDRGEYKDEVIGGKDIDPRLLQNLTYMSQWLTDDEFTELIAISHDQEKFEI